MASPGAGGQPSPAAAGQGSPANLMPPIAAAYSQPPPPQLQQYYAPPQLYAQTGGDGAGAAVPPSMFYYISSGQIQAPQFMMAPQGAQVTPEGIPGPGTTAIPIATPMGAEDLAYAPAAAAQSQPVVFMPMYQQQYYHNAPYAVPASPQNVSSASASPQTMSPRHQSSPMAPMVPPPPQTMAPGAASNASSEPLFSAPAPNQHQHQQQRSAPACGPPPLTPFNKKGMNIVF